ncbi:MULTISPECIES: hypothetical protein [unclassified Empedobacter]|uniref:hypothetical protein n=1 Tax=unclassified Empedobacter TaxID=2643773 RepID=UPI0025C3F118|nr:MULTISPECIES: hypothetical protein [unclassified Empedobacter]
MKTKNKSFDNKLKKNRVSASKSKWHNNLQTSVNPLREAQKCLPTIGSDLNILVKRNDD